MKKVISMILSGLILLGGMPLTLPSVSAGEEPSIRLYADTPDAVIGRDFAVSVDGITVPVEQVYDIGLARFVYLQNRDAITVTVTSKTAAVECVDIYPHSREIAATLDTANNTVTFTLTREQIGRSLKLIVGLNNDTDRELVLLIDTPDTDAPQVGQTGVKSVLDYAGVRNDGTLCTAALQAAIDAAGDDPAVEVLYFPAGTYLTGRLVISKDSTQIYLADGALIKGSDELSEYPNGETGYGHHDRRNGSVFIHVLGTADKPVKNVKLFGHGVIDGSGMELEAKWHSQNLDNQENWIHLFEGKYVDGLVVEDLIMRNSSNWGCKIENAQNVTMNRINVLNPFNKIWSDGIDISSSENCVYNDSLSYAHDDAIAIMTLQLQENGKEIGDLPGKTSNITFNNHLGRSACSGVRIGWDSSDRIEDLQFNNCEFALTVLGALNFHCLKNGNAFGKITFTNCRWDRANIASEGRFITCFNHQYQQSPIKLELLEFIGCVIEGLPATMHLNGNTIENVLFDSVQMTTGTGNVLLRREADIPKLAVSGSVGLTFADSYGLGDTLSAERFEAEAMTFSQVQNGTNTPGFSGFGFVKGFQQAGSSLKLTTEADITATYPLAIRYQAPNGAVDNVALYVDGRRVSDLTFAATDGEWATVETTVSLSKGAHDIRLQSDTKGNAPLYVDYWTLSAPNKYEAEDAAIEQGKLDTGSVTSVELKEQNAAVRFADIPAAKQIAVKYRAAFDTAATLIVGGQSYPLDLYETRDEWATLLVDVADFTGGEVRIQKSGHGVELYVDGIYALTGDEGGDEVYAQNLIQTLKSTSTYRSSYNGFNANAVDGDPNSFWYGHESVITADTPQFFEVAFGRDCTIEKIELALPPLNYWPDRVQEMRILTSTDGETFEELVPKAEYGFSLSENGNRIAITLDEPVAATAIRIEFYKNVEGGNQGQIGELYVWGAAEGGEATENPLKGVNLATNRPLTLTPAAMVHGSKEAAFDGNVGSFFDCGSMNFPSALTVDLQAVYQLDTVVMKLPENWGSRHQEIGIEVSLDGTNYTELVTRQSFAFNQSEKNVVTVPVDGMARYFKITGYSNDEVDHPGFQLGELELYGRYTASVEGVRLDVAEATLAEGETHQLTATVLPEGQCSSEIAWSSSDVSVATVSHDGLVTAVAAGTCTIRARTKDGDHVATLVLTVTEKEPDDEIKSLRGDVNGDGEVNTTDARLVLQYAVDKIDEDALDLSVADVNNSNTVDTTDARLILQKAVGKIEDFD